MTRREKIRQIISGLRGYSPQKIVLFGSQVAGKPHGCSDVDIIVVKETKARFVDRLKEVTEFLDVPFAVDVLVYTPQELQEMVARGNPFITSALESGIVVYERPRRRRKAVAAAGRG